MSSRAQNNSEILRRRDRVELTRDFSELMAAQMSKHRDSVKDVADASRIAPARIRAFLSGEALPTRREFRMLGHALTGLSFSYPIDWLPVEEAHPPRTASGPDAPSPEEEEPTMAETKKPASSAPGLSQHVQVARLGKLAGQLASDLTLEQRNRLLEMLAQAGALDMSAIDVHAIFEE